MSRDDLANIHNVLTSEASESFVKEFQIPKSLHPPLSENEETAGVRNGKMAIYTQNFYFSNIRYPLTSFQSDLLEFFGVHFAQMHPLGFPKVTQNFYFSKSDKNRTTSPTR
jgi:hypothetical protein